MQRLFTIWSVLCCLIVSGASAQMTEPEIAAETARLAFKVGRWSVSANIGNSPTTYLEGSGSLDIDRDATGMLITLMDISFEDFKVVGTTTRRFNPAAGRWDVAWLPVEGDTVPDIEGHFRDGRFIEINYGADVRGPFIGRLVVYNISHDHFSVRRDRLYDDGALAQEIWAYEATRVSGPGGGADSPGTG